MTVLDLLDQMQTHLGVPWQSQRAGGFSDGVLAGDPYAHVTGILTCFTPTVDVLRHAISSGHNTVICRESPFYSRGEKQPVAYRSGAMPAKELLESDPVYQAKLALINTNSLIIVRFVDNWDARKTDGQLEGLAKAIKWDQYHLAIKGDKHFYRPGNNFFSIPPTPLGALARGMMESLNARTIRVMGDEHSVVKKAAILHGLVLVPDLQAAFAETGVDLVIAGEPVEWEGAEYLQDMISAKMAKGAIFLGSEVSEEPGSGEMAAWLKTFVQLPVQWLPSGSPFTPISQETK
jgi:putative NIF3 family GTP cyclohydrolase 1 type 2